MNVADVRFGFDAVCDGVGYAQMICRSWCFNQCQKMLIILSWFYQTGDNMGWDLCPKSQ